MEQAEARLNGRTSPRTILDWLPLVARVLVGAVFIAASIEKILDPAAFADLVANHDLLPLPVVNGFAIILPWLEILIGVLLIAGIWIPGSVLLANALLIMFASALGINMLRGVDVHCGCFTTHPAGSPDMLATLLRDFIILIPSGYLAVKYLFKRE